MITKLTVEERAKRMAGNLYGVLLDYEEEMPSVVISFFIKEIREAEEAAQREAMEKCAEELIKYSWPDAAMRIRALIEENKGGKTCPE